MPPLFILCLLSLFSLCLSDSNYTPVVFSTICSSNQTPNATGFDVNFVNTMESIYENITKTGFGYAVSGSNNSNSSPIVYGLGQCFSYLSTTDCQLCYAQSRIKLPHCLPSIDARIYLDGCFLRYSGFDFFSDAIDASDNFTCGNSTFDGSASVFENATKKLMRNLTTVALSLSNGSYQVLKNCFSIHKYIYIPYINISLKENKMKNPVSGGQCWRGVWHEGLRHGGMLEYIKQDWVQWVPFECHRQSAELSTGEGWYGYERRLFRQVLHRPILFVIIFIQKWFIR